MLTIAARDSLFGSWVPTHVSLHSAWPTQAGSNELAGGAYARVAITIGASSGAKRAATNQPVVNVPAATTVRFVGLWSAITSGNFLGMFPLSGIEQRFFADPVADVIVCQTHGYQTGQKVVFISGTPAAPLVEGTTYFVISTTPNTFQVSATLNGTPINLTTTSLGPCKVSLIEEYTTAPAAKIQINGLSQRMADTVVSQNPVWASIPTINFTFGQFQQVDVKPYVSSPQGNPITITDPVTDAPFSTGVTYNSITHLVTYDGNGPVAFSDHQFLADDTVGVNLVTLGLTSTLSGTFPFSVGHVFKQGDVPAGSTVIASIARFHFIPKVFWPDGSVKWGYCTGKTTFTANVKTNIQLMSGAIVSQPTLQESDLSTAISLNLPNINFAGIGNVALANLIGTPNRVIYIGAESSSWFYGAGVGTDPSLTAWYEVRLFKDGEVQLIAPSLENGYLNVTGQTEKTGDVTVFVGSTVVYSHTAFNMKCRTHIPLVQGTAFSYWIGTPNPQIVPQIDRVYWQATGLIPNYYPNVPVTADIAKYPQAYVPPFAVTGGTQAMLGNDGPAMGSTGRQVRIGLHPQENVYFITSSGDRGAYNALVVNGFTSGSWNHCVRDETTNQHLLFATYPTTTTGSIPATGGANYGAIFGGPTFIASGTDRAHLPNYGYIPYLVTGWHWFLEEMLHWIDNLYLGAQNGSQARLQSKCVFGTGQTRDRAWSLNLLSHLATITPPDHPKQPELIASWQWNTDHLVSRFVTGTFNESLYFFIENQPAVNGSFVNNLGVIYPYSANPNARTAYSPEGAPPGPSTAYWEASWMQSWVAAVLGNAWNLGINQSTQSVSDHQRARDFTYIHVIGLLGDGSAGTWHYRRMDPYQMPVALVGSQLIPVTWFANMGAAYQEYVTGSNTAPDSGTGGVPMQFLDNSSTTIMYHGDGHVISAGDWSGSFAGNHLPGISVAVEHGFPGSMAAWTRLTSSVSFITTGFGPDPVWGVKPRNV